MQSQMLVGGAKLEDVPAFRAILAREHRRIRDEYETRLRDLEMERHAVEEDRQQVRAGWVGVVSAFCAGLCV